MPTENAAKTAPAEPATHYATPIADASPLVDLSMNMPPQPADAFLRESIRDGIGAVLSSPHALLQLHYQDNAGAPLDRPPARFSWSRALA